MRSAGRLMVGLLRPLHRPKVKRPTTYSLRSLIPLFILYMDTDTYFRLGVFVIAAKRYDRFS